MLRSRGRLRWLGMGLSAVGRIGRSCSRRGRAYALSLCVILSLGMASCLASATSAVEAAVPPACLVLVPTDAKSLFAADGGIGRAEAGRTNFPRRRPATGEAVFIFAPNKPAWAAYDARGRLVRTGYASGGKGYCADVKRRCRTPVGSFRISRKGTPYCKSSKYPLGKGGAPMPYCMFFYRGYAIHGSPHVPAHNASHGCIRVLPKDAAWLHKHFLHTGTRVIVRRY